MNGFIARIETPKFAKYTSGTADPKHAARGLQDSLFYSARDALPSALCRVFATGGIVLFITGVSGLLGSAILLSVVDSENAAAGQYWKHPINVPGAKTYQLNLLDMQSTRDLLYSLKPEAIIHCAAATNVDWCEDHPQDAEMMNAQVPAFLAETAREMGIRFVHISTDAVFDGTVGNYSETDTPNPINEYAKSKLRGEQEALRFNPETLVLRVNIYGWNAQEKSSLAEWILGGLSAGNPVPGFTDVWFCPTLANDLAEAILDMLQRKLTGIFHVVGPEKISKYDFARRLAQTFDYDPDRVKPSSLADAKLAAARSPNMSLNTAKVSGALGRVLPDVRSGLLRLRQLQESGYTNRLKGYMSAAEL